MAYNRDYALNAICPYFTMFPLEYPLRVIKKHSSENPVIVDPFCGRGTTIYAARKLGLRSYGFDTSPIAVAIAKAKLASASVERVIALAEHLLQRQPSDLPDTEFFKAAYSSDTLLDICRLREGLMLLPDESDESTLLRAAALGCLHGPLANDVSLSGYFSNQMPRTFASKPDYSVRYWKQNGLEAPHVQVLAVLRRKLERISELGSTAVGSFRRIMCADARTAAPYRNLTGRFVVVTSPPYYGMRTYVQDQWLRNWFLGGPAQVHYETDMQLRHSSHECFVHDLARVWSHLRKRAEAIDLYVRLGTIPSVKSDARALLKASLDESSGWRLVSTRRADTASAGKRQADQMGKSTPEDEFDFHAVAN
ncbi:MAG: site-specific DNA-methyltransferase [Bryobacteraceae bacterium]|nr:site-specific DNA-methyltransferase [Bryobacteraceae bacterium]